MRNIFPIEEAINFSKEKIKKHFWFFVLFSIIFVVVLILPGFFLKTRENGTRIITTPYFFASLISWFLNILISIGIIKICLDIVYNRNEEIRIQELFSHIKFFIKYFLSSLLYGLMVSVLIVIILFLELLVFASLPYLFFSNLFILIAVIILLSIAGVVGIIFCIVMAIRLSFYRYYIVEGCGVIESFKNSYNLTKDLIWSLIGFNFVLGIINLLGLLFFGIGFLITCPLTFIASAYVYKKLKEADSSLITPTQKFKL